MHCESVAHRAHVRLHQLALDKAKKTTACAHCSFEHADAWLMQAHTALQHEHARSLVRTADNGDGQHSIDDGPLWLVI